MHSPCGSSSSAYMIRSRPNPCIDCGKLTGDGKRCLRCRDRLTMTPQVYELVYWDGGPKNFIEYHRLLESLGV